MPAPVIPFWTFRWPKASLAIVVAIIIATCITTGAVTYIYSYQPFIMILTTNIRYVKFSELIRVATREEEMGARWLELWVGRWAKLADFVPTHSLKANAESWCWTFERVRRVIWQKGIYLRVCPLIILTRARCSDVPVRTRLLVSLTFLPCRRWRLKNGRTSLSRMALIIWWLGFWFFRWNRPAVSYISL